MKIFADGLVGTLTLVLFGCGAPALAGEHVGQLGIAFAFGHAMSQLWLFLVAPLVGAGLAGMKCRIGLLDRDAA